MQIQLLMLSNNLLIVGVRLSKVIEISARNGLKHRIISTQINKNKVSEIFYFFY